MNIFQNCINNFLTIFFFWPKSEKFCIFLTLQFCSNLPACSSDAYHVRRLKTSNVSISDSIIKCPIWKSIFAVYLPLKLFHAIVANADTENLKPLMSLYIFWCVLGPHTGKIWIKSYILQCTKFWSFRQKPSV